MNLFFENSTRTRTTFDVAAKRLGASVISIDIAKSSTQKGESLRDKTVVIIEEIRSGGWGVGGQALTTEDVKNLPATG